MKGLLLKLGDIKNFKIVHLRHLLQSVLVLSCFCTLDTIAINNTIWLISAAAAVVAIGLAMLSVDRISLGKWTNALNIITAALCAGCYFSEICFPFAVFFATLTAVIRLAYARRELNDYCTLVFIIASVFFGIVIRFALIHLPVWSLGVLMLATVFNPVITGTRFRCKPRLHRQGDEVCPNGQTLSPVDGGAMPLQASIFASGGGKQKAEQQQDGQQTEPDEPVQKTDAKKYNPLIIIAGIMLVVFMLCIEVFGGTLTDEVSHTFLMETVNLSYIAGYTLFIAAILFFRIKTVSVAAMILAIFGLFFFLLPPTTTFGIYFLLFLGGGIKVLMLAFPITAFKGKYKILGAFGGVFVYRLAFLTSGTTKALAGEYWHIVSPLTYALAVVNIALAIGLIFLLIYWDRKEIKAEYDARPPIIKEVIREIPVVIEVPVEIPVIKNPLPKDLSEQERRIAEMILHGKTRSEICAEMDLKEGTVKSYIARIYTKAGVDNQRQFAARYLGSEQKN